MAFDDMTAFGAIRALNRAGIRVPEQCSVIGFDDVSPAAICTPSLTTIRQPMELMGDLAVKIIVEAMGTIQEKTVPKRCTVRSLLNLWQGNRLRACNSG